MRPFLALYVGGMGSREKNFYNQLVQRYGFEDAAEEVQDLYLEGKQEEAAAALPDELIDMVVARRPARRRARAAGGLPRRGRRHARRHAAGVRQGRAASSSCGCVAELAARLIAGCGSSSAPSATRATRSRSSRWARALARARPRGDAADVDALAASTSSAEGMRFARRARVPRLPHARAAAEALRGGRARGAARRAPLVARRRGPTCVVADILTLAPGAGRRARGRAGGDAHPPRRPAHGAPGFPPYSIGARLPRTRGRAARCGGATDRARRARAASAGATSSTRRAGGSGCRRWTASTAGSRSALALVGDASRSSSTRARWPPRDARRRAAAVGAAGEPTSSRRPGDGPLVLVAPSTVAGPEHRLLRAALAGLADEPVRVLATWNRRAARPRRSTCPANARLVDWVSYARTMPRCDVVVCHAGHGTLVRALAGGLRRRRRARPPAT